jgi:hypothetical protein
MDGRSGVRPDPGIAGREKSGFPNHGAETSKVSPCARGYGESGSKTLIHRPVKIEVDLFNRLTYKVFQVGRIAPCAPRTRRNPSKINEFAATRK